MSAIDSLISKRSMDFGNERPEITSALLYVFTRESNLPTAHFGLRRVGLPDVDGALVAATSVALGILATLATNEALDEVWSESLAESIMISAMRARKIVNAKALDDLHTTDSLSRTSFDPTDPITGTIIEGASSPWADPSDGAERVCQGLTSADLHQANVTTLPDAITRTNVADHEALALDMAMIIGADPAIIEAIMNPDLGNVRSREGDGPVMRAAGLPTSGRGLAASRIKIRQTRRALRVAGTRSVAWHTTSRRASYRAPKINIGDMIRKADGTLALPATAPKLIMSPDRTRWTLEAIVTAAQSPENLYFEPKSHNVGSGYRGNDATRVPVQPVTTEQLAWCAPVTFDRESNGPSGRTHKINHSGFIQESTAGIKFPSRRRKAAGQTGPTVPEILRAPVEIVVIPSPRADFDALISRTK